MITGKELNEDIIRGNSPEVFRRLLLFLKPYKPAAAMVLVSLILATAAELLMPVIMKKTLDEHLLRQENRLPVLLSGPGTVDNGADNINPLISKEIQQKGILIAGSLFVSSKQITDLSRRDIREGRDKGWIDKDDWYTIIRPDSTVLSVIDSHRTLFLSDKKSELFALRIKDMETLTTEERRILRSDDLSGLKSRSLQYFILLLSVLVFTFIQVYQASWIGQKIMADIRQGLLEHIMRQSLGYLGRTPTGSLVSRTSNDVETINEFFTNVTISFLKDGSIMGGVVLVIFTLDTRLALATLITLIPAIILILLFQKRVRESFRRVRAGLSAVNSYLSERLGGMTTVQLFAAEERSRAEFGGKNDSLLEAQLGQMRIMAVFRPLIDTIASVAVALVIWYSTGLHTRGLVTLGVLIAFIELIQKFFHPVRDIAEKFNILQSALAGGERIFAMMDSIDRIPDTGENEPSSGNNPLSGDIRFENVQFSYLPGEPVLKGLSFHISPGQTVAVVGTTGAGKTTIANLLTRLWDPEKGEILLDGRNIRSLSLRDLRQTIQPVQQDVFLFSGSIAENIHLGIDMTEEQIRNAGILSRADVFIRQLPEGYSTHITEGAGNLSAGQRQLIAFARIIAHNPGVIILDEATANVDTETETLLQEGMEKLLENRTSVIIAHRLSTIRKADRILVIDEGKIIEQGSHRELLASKGVYSNLYRLQSGNETSENPE